MSEKRKYRTFTPEQKSEIVLAGLRGDRSVRDICREYEIGVGDPRRLVSSDA
jgi:transposase